MKFFLVAFVSMVVCGASVSATSLIDPESMRQSIKCGDGVFGELAKEHKELEKFHVEYKTLAGEAIQKLDECSQIKEVEEKDECVESILIHFSMMKLTELITKIEMEHGELANKLMDSIEENCQ